MRGSNLSGAVSTSQQTTSRVFGANLHKADLRGADLRESILVRVKFDYADLRGANFAGANMTRVSLIGSKFELSAFDEAINV